MLITNYDVTTQYNLDAIIDANIDLLSTPIYGLTNDINMYKSQAFEEFAFSDFTFYSAILYSDTIEVEFDIKYKYQPGLVAFDYYGDIKLAHLVLHSNKIDEPLKFTEEYIQTDALIIPSIDSVKLALAMFTKEHNLNTDFIDVLK